MLLAEFCRTSPEAYDMQYTTNQVSVRLAGVCQCLLVAWTVQRSLLQVINSAHQPLQDERFQLVPGLL